MAAYPELVTLQLAGDELCPGCNSMGPNGCNRPKVGDEQGYWWWKCYTPDCQVGYYQPELARYETKEDLPDGAAFRYLVTNGKGA